MSTNGCICAGNNHISSALPLSNLEIHSSHRLTEKASPQVMHLNPFINTTVGLRYA